MLAALNRFQVFQARVSLLSVSVHTNYRGALFMQEILCSLLRFADKFSPPKKVYAHCDIPCGVYETDSMEHAVETIEKLTKKLLDTGAMGNDMQINDRNTFIRSIDVREKYAQTCKQEILVLWTDYF